MGQDKPAWMMLFHVRDRDGLFAAFIGSLGPNIPVIGSHLFILGIQPCGFGIPLFFFGRRLFVFHLCVAGARIRACRLYFGAGSGRCRHGGATGRAGGGHEGRSAADA